MRNVIILSLLGLGVASDVDELVEFSPLLSDVEESQCSEDLSDSETASLSASSSEPKSDDLSDMDAEILQEALSDVSYFEENSNMSDLGEVIEEMVRYRKLLYPHKNDFQRAIDERNISLIFLKTFTEIQDHSGLEELQTYYAQLYYDQQIAALYARLDRGRSTLSQSLAANNYRTSYTQQAINSLNVQAALLKLNLHSEAADLGLVKQFFSQKESAHVYFPGIFANLSDKNQQYNLMDIALTYLIERYRADRYWLNKIFHYIGWKHSYTREAVETLLGIAKLLKIDVRADYQQLLAVEDTKMIEDALDYILSLWET